MKTPYLMMRTCDNGSMAFADRPALQWFCVEQAKDLTALLELMAACEESAIAQNAISLAHNLARQVSAAAYVLANGPTGQHCPDWDVEETLRH